MVTYRPIDIARACNVSVSTIYDWSQEFGEFLSEVTLPINSESRYTSRDLKIMQYVAELRAEETNTLEILHALCVTSFGETEPVAAPPETLERSSMSDWLPAALLVVLAAIVILAYVLFVVG